MGVAERWDEVRLGPITVESVRVLHQPPERFRVSLDSHPAATTFTGTARAGRRYVLAGTCSYRVDELLWELRAGDIADLPAGEFTFRGRDGGPVQVVSVWELPAAFLAGVPDAEPGVAGDRGPQPF